MGLGELADWWEAQKRESEEILGEWVADNPQWWAIGIATATSTAMELGAGMVDVLRLGQGLRHGGFLGYASDAMRMLVLLGPLAKTGGTLGRLAHTRSLRLAVTTADVTGPCTFTAVNNAVSIVSRRGQNFFVTAADAARALGIPLRSVRTAGRAYQLAAWIDDLVPFLMKQGVRVRSLGLPGSIDDVVRAAQAHDGVVIFAIEWTNTSGQVLQHSMIAVRTATGVKFADYGGKFISSLKQLTARGGQWATSSGYHIYTSPPRGSAVLVSGLEAIGKLERFGSEVFKKGMLVLEGVHAIQTLEGVDLALPVAPAAAIEKGMHEPEVVKASFGAYRARKQGTPVSKLPPVVMRGRRNGASPVRLIRGVQYRLNALGFGAGPVDGIVGPRTKGAVRSFQSTCGLVADAIPGPNTQRKLTEVCGF